jgi:hypothetical protein
MNLGSLFVLLFPLVLYVTYPWLAPILAPMGPLGGPAIGAMVAFPLVVLPSADQLDWRPKAWAGAAIAALALVIARLVFLWVWRQDVFPTVPLDSWRVVVFGGFVVPFVLEFYRACLVRAADTVAPSVPAAWSTIAGLALGILVETGWRVGLQVELVVAAGWVAGLSWAAHWLVGRNWILAWVAQVFATLAVSGVVDA